MRQLIILLSLFLFGCADLAALNVLSLHHHNQTGVLAPKPLYRDPIFDGAADPSIIFNAAEQKWLMFYTNRRANVPGLTNVTWVHGTPIGIAESVDGANWSYRGTVDFPKDIPGTSAVETATYWAPAVLEYEGTYHMYLTIVPGVFEDWNHSRTIVHLTSRDLKNWVYQSTLPLISDRVIDASVLRLPDGTWRLWYNDERAGKKTFYADSKDLYHWEDKGSANLPNDRGEAPLAFYWKGHYWLINDLLGNIGLGVYKSSDALNWQRQRNNLLDVPGKGTDDQNGGHHPEVIVSGERAFLYYFVHPGVNAESVYEKEPELDVKRSSIQVVELNYVDGWLVAERDNPTHVALLSGSTRTQTQTQTKVSWVDSRAHAGDFPLVANKQSVPIVVAAEDFKVVDIAAQDLAQDIQRVTGRKPLVVTTTQNAVQDLTTPALLIGTLGSSPVIDNLVATGKLDVSELRGKWESFLIAHIEQPFAGMARALVIVGSDRRGTAYGTYELSQAIGVSPWYWWADVVPEQKSALYVRAGTRQFGPPSVKYRGIFINDEGWGIHQWAAKTFEPENGGIGPKTYQKIFELLLRLKANTLWPAMHPVTKPFNHFPKHAQLADDYGIVMGSSHAEPMLRNNVGEWKLPHDQYNYLTQREQVHSYWETRMKTNGKFENIYTMGMRGIHDSYMQGPSNDAERIELLQTIFADQRTLIKKYTHQPLEQVPQMFCAYKEVLGLYRQGLQVPDDITIVWPDDNFGYMRNFSNAEERKRAGGFGLYYHLSYLGAPMAYLWLNTTPPALMWQELHKSYAMGADRIWIANVGDLKPAELGTELFFQMAWDINRWQLPNQQDFLRTWAAREFGAKHAVGIAELMRDYYQLNYQRKPEHLQWWLPRTTPRLSDFNAAEASERLQAFHQLRLRTEQLGKKISAAQQAAFFQLVSYPINGSALANIRFLEGERGNKTAALAADAQLNEITALWNTWLANGKWKHFMAVEPATSEWDKYRIAPWVMPQLARQENETKTVVGQLSFALEAENFTRKMDRPSAGWQVIEGLGRSGKGAVALYPVTAPAINIHSLPQQAPRLEYEVNFPSSGEVTVHFYVIPTHPLIGNTLRFGVALNNNPAQLVELEVKDGSADWAQGVLNATRTVTVQIDVNQTGSQTLQVYGVDAGVLLDKIVVDLDGLPASYLGLPPAL